MLIELGIRICEAVQRTWEADDRAPRGTARRLAPYTVRVQADGTVSSDDIGLTDNEVDEGDPTAVYKAPEATEGYCGIGSDVFVIAAILFEMATGEPLFKGRRAASGDQLTKGLARRLESVGIPGGLDRRIEGFGTMLQKCLQLDRTHRYPNPVAVARRLEQLRRDARIASVDLAEFLAKGSTPALEVEEAPAAEPVAEPAPPPRPEQHWSLAGSTPGAATDAYSLQEHSLDDRVEATRADPWHTDLESEEQIRERMDQRRMTPVERTGNLKPVTEEPTMAAAVRWFLGRVLLVLTLVLCVVIAIAYFGFFPGGTERQIASAWGSLPEVLRESVPQGWVTGAQAWWVDRPAQDVGHPVGAWTLRRMPEHWRRELALEPPTPPVTAGSPLGEGIVASVEGWSEPKAIEQAGFGRLKLTVDVAGRPRGGNVVVRASRRDGGGDPVEWTADTGQELPPAHYDLELVYREAAAAEDLVGRVSGAVVNAGHATTYIVRLDAPYGFVASEFHLLPDGEFEGGDVTRQVTLAGWPETGDEPIGPPTFELPAGPLIGLTAGLWRLRAVLQEEGRGPSEAWFTDVRVDKNDRTLLRRLDMRRGEVLSPEGPGLRVAASNFGADVSDHATVYVFPAGTAAGNAVATASAPAAHYFDVPIGTWDVQVVYAPDPNEPSFRGVEVLERVVIDPGQVVRRTAELALPVAFVDVRVTDDGEDLSEEVRVLGLNPGADFEGATRLFDTEGPGEHAVHPGEYDVYVQVTIEGAWRRTVFKKVRLTAGDTWKQRLDVAHAVWVE